MDELYPLCQQLERIADALEQIAETLGGSRMNLDKT